ncbi:MAG: ATP-binding protein [Ferruginibacter sp.]
MLAEIKRIINEDVSNRVTQYDVLYEAITNSIHANSTKIICTLNSFDNLLNDKEGNELADRKIDTIKVSDNGDGLNEENYKSFCKFRSEYKIKLGCKGVGRFTFLKVYENAKYQSSLLKSQQSRSFVFDSDFDTSNIVTIPEKVKENFTEIFLERITPLYLNPHKNIDRREILELNIIREKVLVHLIPTLFFYKKKGKTIKIDFVD